MRIIAFIFALYFIGLNGLPCTDKFPHPAPEHQTEMLSQLDVHNTHSGLDQCSPFCQCHCCHVHVTELIGVRFQPEAPTQIIAHYFFYTPNAGVHPIKRLFEPPKTQFV